jgi:hypothetical protein
MMQSGQGIPAILRLPIEIRRSVYALLLPHTSAVRSSHDPPTVPAARSLTYVRQKNGTEGWCMLKTSDRQVGNDVVWRRGCTALLALNRQIHEETADMLYGENTFVLDVTFDAIKFRYRWRTVNALTPNRTYPFLEHFSQRNLMRMRRCIVNVESVDDYTGMIKYNCQGRGLPAGIRARVRELTDQLAAVQCLHYLQVHLIDSAISRMKFPSGRVHRVQDEAIYAQTQMVLEPLRLLHGVRRADVSGVSEEYAEDLSRSMTAQRGACLT